MVELATARERARTDAVSAWMSAALYLFWLAALVIMYCDLDGNLHNIPYGNDAEIYLRMAGRVFDHVYPPYVFRFLTPWLVRGLREGSLYFFNWDAAWYLVDTAALFGTALLFDRLLRRVLKIDGYTTTLSVLMLLSNFVYSIFLFRDPFLVDAPNNFFWMLGIYALFTDKQTLFFAAMAVGALNKEVVLFLMPLAPIFAWMRTRSIRDASVVRALAAAAGVAVFYAAYRAGVEAYFGRSFPLFTAMDMDRATTFRTALHGQRTIWDLFDTFKFLWVTFAFALWDIYERYGWRNRYFLAAMYVLAALSFGRMFAADTNRVFAMAGPFVVGMSALFFVSSDVTLSRVVAIALLVNMAMNVAFLDQREYQLLANVGVLLMLVLVKRCRVTDDLSAGTRAELAKV
jgi:hypothetical protein